MAMVMYCVHDDTHHITGYGYTVVSYTHVRTYVTVQNNYNGKVPDIAALHAYATFLPSVGLHHIVVPS
jgi:hypothetical protein